MHYLSHEPTQYLPRSIRTINSFRLNGWKVDLMEVRTTSPLPAILDFHLTTLMNYVSLDVIFSAYSALTSRERGIVNPILQHLGSWTLQTLRTLDKYKARSIQIQMPMQSRETDQQTGWFAHVCRWSMTCSETQRTNMDKGCLCMPLELFSMNSLEDTDVQPHQTLIS